MSNWLMFAGKLVNFGTVRYVDTDNMRVYIYFDWDSEGDIQWLYELYGTLAERDARYEELKVLLGEVKK